jgi:hypothetical protein
MMFTHRHLDPKRPTAFDRRVDTPPNLTYGILIGRIPSHRHQVAGFTIETPYNMQVAHYLVRPTRQSHISNTFFTEGFDGLC